MTKHLITRQPMQSASSALTYEEQKRLVQSRDPEVRRALAERTDVRPEILYYMAQDASPAVRRALAANSATPVQADLILARDADDEVRCDLALKIARLVPDMDPREQERVRELTLETLELLAQDQLPRVRAIVAEEIKRSDAVPRRMVQKLARDVEAIVAAPILEYSPLLSDADLIEVIAAGTAREALAAIARREKLSAEVSDAVVATMDVAAVADLLANRSAQIREDTLDRIVENASQIEDWHNPLVLRPELSIRAIRRIAGFVAASLVEILAARNGLDEETVAFLNERVRERLREEEPGQAEEEERAQRMFAAGTLDDDALCDAIQAGQRTFVIVALAQAAALPREVVRRGLRSGSGQVVAAVVWQAGFSMRTALQVQTRIAKLPPGRILNARNGTDYPLSVSEMRALLAELQAGAA